MKINLSYLRFLSLLSALEEESEAVSLDAIEEQLLDHITLSFSQGREVLVGDLLQLSNLGSQATLHGRIKSLTSKGYVDLKMDLVDNRKKKVTPSKLAMRHYEKLSRLLSKCHIH